MSDTFTILGAGTMGHGIAQIAAVAGYDVRLYDLDETVMKAALVHIVANLNKGVSKGKVTEEDAKAALDRITTATELAVAVENAGVVIEAAPEKMDLKKELFAEVSEQVSQETILGTNTSSLSVTEIASAARHPERVVGTHFFNPPYALKLLEVIRAERTSDETVGRITKVGERLGREIVVVSDTPGFATSRLGLVIGLEAIRMVQEGVASPEDIDKAMMLGYGYPMGPLRLGDLVGLDVRLAIAEHLHRELGEQFRPPALLRRMVRAGKLGKKSGEGFYRW